MVYVDQINQMVSLAVWQSASTILTWNVRHFTPFADEIAIEAPP